MHKHTARSRVLAWVLMTLFTVMGVQVPANAAIVGTDQIVAETELDAQRAELNELLLRDDVRQQLIDMGVDVEHVQERIDHMTASELAQLDGKMEELPAGGVLGAVLAVILILILLDVLGTTDVFPNV